MHLNTRHRFIFGLLLIVALATEVSAQNRTHRRRGIILGGLAGAALGVAIGDKGNNETAGALIGAAAGAIAGGAIGNQKDQRIEQEMRLRWDIQGSAGSGYRPHYPMESWNDQPDSTGFRNSHLEYPGNIPTANRAMRSPSLPLYNLPHDNPDPRSYLSNPYVAPDGKITDYRWRTSRQPMPQRQRRSGALDIADVISMMRSGVNQTLILRQVEMQGIQHQLSTSDIITLHENGVSSEIIEAMQIKSMQQQNSMSTSNPTDPAPPRSPGIENLLPPPSFETR